MSSHLVLSVKDAAVSFHGKHLFEALSFNIHQGNRISLVGKNGAGKTTLMRLICGELEMDDGERWEEPGISIGYMKQDVVPKPGQTVFEYIFEEIKAEEKEQHEYKVEIMADVFELDVHAEMTNLSGGQIRRAALARSLVEEPDILLLDEPTNHLDLSAIEWLEEYLKSYRGTLLCISHDKMFLANISNKVFWLDRGTIKVCPKGFGYFEEWSSMLLEQEARELRNRAQAVAQEVEWASRGVKARRKRNVRRLEKMHEAREQLKKDMSAYRRVTSKIVLSPPEEVDASSRVVAEFFNVCKSFNRPETEGGEAREITILDKFNFRIKRGDRVGILGRNGSGKTTFLKMLLGEETPDTGKVKRAQTLEISYFDQKRRDLDPDFTLWKTLCPEGGEYVDVGKKQRHVCGYLKDFMFDPQDAQRKVGTLSGGEKNRLMLARVLANPGNFLILDEPTNDLDMDTLDMLEDILSEYEGTLFVVSHDRDFLDQMVTKILAFEGDGKIEGYIGGYSDYMDAVKKQRANEDDKGFSESQAAASKEEKNDRAEENEAPLAEPVKMTYKLKYELEQLPEKIAKLEADIQRLQNKLADPDFYGEDPDKFHAYSVRLPKLKEDLDAAELRWLELEEMKQQAEG